MKSIFWNSLALYVFCVCAKADILLPPEIRARYLQLGPFNGLDWNCGAENELWTQTTKSIQEYANLVEQDRKQTHQLHRGDLKFLRQYDANLYYPALEEIKALRQNLLSQHEFRIAHCLDVIQDSSLNKPDVPKSCNGFEMRIDDSLFWKPKIPGSTRTNNPPPANYPKTKDGDWDPSKSAQTKGVPCQDLINRARLKIDLMENAAAYQLQKDRINCGRDLNCLKAADEAGDRRTAEIRAEDKRLSQQIRDCQAAASGKNQYGDWIPPDQAAANGTNQYGDWLPPDFKPAEGDWLSDITRGPIQPFCISCDSMAKTNRERMRAMIQQVNQQNAQENKACGRDLACLDRAREHGAQRSRQVNVEDAKLTKDLRDCQVIAKYYSAK